jgi:hypothetical protein
VEEEGEEGVGGARPQRERDGERREKFESTRAGGDASRRMSVSAA